jgi:ferritin-like protein
MAKTAICFKANQAYLAFYSLKTTFMKTMTCSQLGGACDEEFHAETIEEMTELSKKHATEMIEKGDEAHIKAMREMQELMHFSEGMNAWFENKRKTFDCLAHDNN